MNMCLTLALTPYSFYEYFNAFYLHNTSRIVLQDDIFSVERKSTQYEHDDFFYATI